MRQFQDDQFRAALVHEFSDVVEHGGELRADRHPVVDVKRGRMRDGRDAQVEPA
jgi:hypothetical protein